MSNAWSADGSTRRTFLAAGGALAAGAAFGLTGCSDPSQGKSSNVIKVPDPKRKLPKGDVSLRVMDSGDTKAAFWEEFAAAYEKKHGNISVDYAALPWNRIEEVAPLGIRNGTAHDILQLPQSMPLAKAVAEGWVAPVNDLIPDFEKWRAGFPEGTFVEGVQVFDGKLYAVPPASEQRHQALLHYNTRLMEEAGYDPQAKPLTWDQFRAAAKKITKQGNGRSYGFVLEVAQPERLEFLVHYLASSARSASVNYRPHGFIDPRKGEFAYTDDAFAEAIELLLALKKDGSVFPGSSSLTAPEAWPRVLRGHAGMVAAGPWVTEQWQEEKPDFDFGVAGHPVAGPDGYPMSYPMFGTDGVVVFAKSKAKPVVGDVLSYLGSLAGQQAWGKIVGAGNPPINEQAREAAKKGASPQARQCLKLADAMRSRPEPVTRNSQVTLLAEKQKQVTPSFGEVVQALFLGKTDDVRGELRKLSDRSDRLLDKAVADARKEGVKVSREDFVFPDWDPSRDYTGSGPKPK
ncbi:extracellular solute-binding protein [Streptomyces armeniacus]|uniref:Extracellular solute-binding protein n=1 Tax=Streptomyces armeniacus TaxID=83291 RepID=A0A345XJ01_9ACTN|nr:extracellular solute-binding protein [Streptomyces armeniacus]AXK31617.1 extracellular solute-binding protein [Streptomyces armeniacus]